MFPYSQWAGGSIYPRDFLSALDSPGDIRVIQNKDANGNDDGSYHVEMRVYNASGGALVKGQPYLLTPTGVQATNMTIITPAALASVPRIVVFAVDTTANNTWCWVAIGGWIDANITGAQTIGNFLKVAAGTSTTALVTDGSTQTTGSCGVVATTRASGTGVDRCFIYGLPIVCN